MPYPDTVNLPFNRACLKDDFHPLPPDAPVTGEPGYLLLIQGGDLVVLNQDGAPFLPMGPLPDWVEPESTVIIGFWQGKPLRAGRVSRTMSLPVPFTAEPFNAYSDRLDDQLLTLGGIARTLLAWDRESAHCPRCGGGMKRHPGSWGRHCIHCGLERFPPTHPCAIVLVQRNDEFLLGRKAIWPEGRYSLIAGFLDAGESLEECARREVREETGVEITNLRYVGSQNWPFPSQIMAGFVADYAGGEVTVDGDELEDARWFTIHSPPPALPSKRSIARWIIDRYALKTECA
jgi:NAD+ diphosphatase